jgi:hypothetical protein
VAGLRLGNVTDGDQPKPPAFVKQPGTSQPLDASGRIVAPVVARWSPDRYMARSWSWSRSRSSGRPRSRHWSPRWPPRRSLRPDAPWWSLRWSLRPFAFWRSLRSARPRRRPTARVACRHACRCSNEASGPCGSAPKQMLGIGDVPALAVLDGLLDRPIPHPAALDGGGPLAQLPHPCRLQQLDRVGVGALAPRLHAQQLASPVRQVGVGLLVRLVLLLLLVAGVAFAVGGTVSGLPGDLVCLLRLLVLLTRVRQVASAQPPGRTMLQAGDQVGRAAGDRSPRPAAARPARACQSLDQECTRGQAR